VSRCQRHFLLICRQIWPREAFSVPLLSQSKQNLSQRAVLETTFRIFIGKFVAESRSRDHLSHFYRKICRREPFSRPPFAFLSENLSQRAVLETTFHIFIAEFVAESRSQNHISYFYRKICRREQFSKPHFTILSQNLSQRAVLKTTFRIFIGKFVAESRSRNHIFLFYRKICRREPVSRPFPPFSPHTMSLRCHLPQTINFFRKTAINV